MKRKFVVLMAVLAVACWAAVGSADTFSFFNITNNTTNTGSQFFVDVTSEGSGSVRFTFRNAGPAGSSIEGVYFQGGPLLNLTSVINMAGVAFTQDSISKVSPANPPGANNITPAFVTAQHSSADADPPVNPNGVGRGEQLGIIFTLQGSQTFADILAAIGSGALRIDIHVQSIPPTGDSDSFVNNPNGVPIPPTALLLGSGLLGLALLGLRKRRAAKRFHKFEPAGFLKSYLVFSKKSVAERIAKGKEFAHLK